MIPVENSESARGGAALAAPPRTTSGGKRPPISHIFTVDVEEYFQVSAFERLVARSDWSARESRVESNVALLLDLLATHGAHGTFFVLGWVASAHKPLVRRIVAEGHEIASHGWAHRRVTSLSPNEFRADIRRTKALLEGLTGERVCGYRAPSFSILPGWEWAFDILLEEGYLYDSSLFPIRRPGYGYPDAAKTHHTVQRLGGTLHELPMTTLPLGGLRIPASGGAYFRHFPYGITQRALREYAEQGTPAVFYLHPWEVDAAQPRLPVPWLTRVRHYRGLERVVPRLQTMLSEFHFTSVRRGFGLGADAGEQSWRSAAS